MPEVPKNVTENKVVEKDRERSIEEADVGTESQTSAQKRVIRLPSRRFRAGLFIPFAFLSSIPIPQPARSPVFCFFVRLLLQHPPDPIFTTLHSLIVRSLTSSSPSLHLQLPLVPGDAFLHVLASFTSTVRRMTPA